MGDKRDKDQKKLLKAEDIELWKEMTKDVKPLLERPYLEGEELEEEEDLQKSMPITTLNDKTSPKAQKSQIKQGASSALPQSQDIDRRTADRLRRGQMVIDGRLDLHGLSRDNAYVALGAFIKRSYGRGHRCVLVITGKGRSGKSASESAWLEGEERGVLRRALPDWLAEDAMRAMVLRAVSAQPKDGGDGAFYVLLRRNRAL